MKSVLRKSCLVIGILTLVVSALGIAAAEEGGPTASADVGVYSKYIWRGWELSDDSLVVQPSITVGYKGFSMNLWGNLDMDFDDPDPATSNKAEWTETDWTLSYDRSFGMLNLGVGYVYYALDAIDDSQEVYLSAGLDILLSPTLTVYREVAHLPGWYLNFGISHSFELLKDRGITLDLSASAGYYISDDDDFVEFDDNLNPTTERYRDFHEGLISAALTIPLGEVFTLSPTIAYSFALSNAADNLLTASSFSNRSDHLFGGISVSMAF